MINRLLVANRGEIARRVFATCRRLGIETVAVHSDADAGWPFVAEADLAVRLPGNAPGETYLDVERLLEAARRTGADAVHPGYGFLSENAGFARAVLDAGLTWVGPDPESIDAMGDKIRAKELMAAAGVPVLEAPAEPTADDLPLLVKAAAGGGGRGMRVVRGLDELERVTEAARAEAQSAFGDGRVFVEPYVEAGRHLEVQVVGHDGGVLVLGERDCSVQRRHQKVIEEAPAPALPEATRAALHDAARRAAEAISYRGAGTVEFLYDAPGDRFFFLEMNTRLQVEHPVTECVHDVDLVELQLAVAEGRPVVADAVGGPRGHAVEVRLYAEDPAADYQPQGGRLATFEVPHDVAFERPARAGVRLDSAVVSGDEVSTHYDAMLAKVVAWAPTRDEAVRRLVGALRRARVHGLTTNRDQLLEVLRSEAFGAGGVTTGFLEEHPPEATTPGDARAQAQAFLAAAVAATEEAAGRRTVQRGVPSGWRNVHSAPQVTTFARGETHVPVSWRRGRDGIELVDEEVPGVRCVEATREPGGWRVTTELEGVRTAHRVRLDGERVDVDWYAGHLALRAVPRFADPAAAHRSGSLLAPMPGTVVKVLVEAGDRVQEGDPVLVLEAMKMQHTVTAPHAGTVTEVDIEAGAQVAAGNVMVVVEEEQ